MSVKQSTSQGGLVSGPIHLELGRSGRSRSERLVPLPAKRTGVPRGLPLLAAPRISPGSYVGEQRTSRLRCPSKFLSIPASKDLAAYWILPLQRLRTFQAVVKVCCWHQDLSVATCVR